MEKDAIVEKAPFSPPTVYDVEHLANPWCRRIHQNDFGLDETPLCELRRNCDEQATHIVGGWTNPNGTGLRGWRGCEEHTRAFCKRAKIKMAWSEND